MLSIKTLHIRCALYGHFQSLAPGLPATRYDPDFLDRAQERWNVTGVHFTGLLRIINIGESYASWFKAILPAPGISAVAVCAFGSSNWMPRKFDWTGG